MFVRRLNKSLDGLYSIEEKKVMSEGKWEGYLNHGNINPDTLMVYTGEKLTGEKVDNYFLSTPSNTPWKAYLKVFSDAPEVYVTYESSGDQVDADDINLLQEIAELTTDDLSQYKQATDGEVDTLKNRATNLENTRAKKTYVDTELNKKYNKEQVYTKEEVMQKVKELIGTAPEALDTLGKLADALDNDPNFATTVINLLADKVDVVDGKGLSDENYSLGEKNKLAGVEAGANKYIHPATHSANIIVENTNRRFVTDLEKAEIVKVKDKADKTYVDGELTKKETPAGSQAKATQALNDSKSYVDNKVKTNVPVGAKFTDTIVDISGKADTSSVPTKVSQLTNDSNFITESELGTAGYGDMSKSVYDKNNNGKIDLAENSEKLGGKLPSQYMKVGPLTWNNLKGV